MAWNPSPEVAIARDAAKGLDDAPICIVFWLTHKNQLGMASYGKTKALCAQAKILGDAAFDALMKTEQQT